VVEKGTPMKPDRSKNDNSRGTAIPRVNGWGRYVGSDKEREKPSILVHTGESRGEGTSRDLRYCIPEGNREGKTFKVKGREENGGGGIRSQPFLYW